MRIRKLKAMLWENGLRSGERMQFLQRWTGSLTEVDPVSPDGEGGGWNGFQAGDRKQVLEVILGGV